MRGLDGPHFAWLLCVTMQNSAHLVLDLLRSHDGVIGKACTKNCFLHILRFIDVLEW